ncbi:hypothetical protein ES288_A09G207300v1 [Gossypium darwinii]|uniref:Golgin candidate 2 n=1 Tax=Gossypium darwinii TaxID=34276 RepID=A0A5D2FCV3_GOSDA|nr:hypothetical protein ES288_A09G207300v1 [Gossypium darwinii]
MANWISSKLKVAETLLQQIDQQAAESLGKNEKQLSDEITLDTPTKPNGGVSLKDQLKRQPQDNNDYQGKLFSDPISNMPSNNNDSKSYNSVNITSREKEISRTRASSKPNTKLTDSDWTELLSTPSQGTSSSTNGVFGIRSLKKDGGTKGHLGSHLSLLEEKWKQKRNVNGSKSVRRSDIVLGNKLNGKRSNGEESSASVRPSSVDKQNDGKNSEELELDHKDTPASFMVKMKDSRDEENDRKLDSKELLINLEGFSLSANKNQSTRKVLDLGEVDGVPDALIGIADAHGQFRTTVSGKSKSIGSSRSSVFDGVKGASQPSSDASSDLDPDSGSASDSESEHEREERRKRKERLMAERAAVKAVDAIKERENTVARLEGEKQSLEKILEEGAKQHAQEASELQTTTMEMMDAVELEKQKHNDTRMEALQRLAKLETTNADLARSLATAQKRLEVEARQLEASIELTRKAVEDPTEVEVELKRRLGLLTDHLIQKQAQVEALSSEKATLSFRIEAVSRILEEGKSTNMNIATSSDLELGTWGLSSSKLNPVLKDKIRSGKRQLGSTIKQLDAIFLAGAIFLRRNATAKVWSLVYLICLHVWVIYILMSHSRPSDEERSGAVMSLGKYQ